MNKLLRTIVYSRSFSLINKVLLSLFYDKNRLSGKFFDEQRYGFVWAWKCIFRSFKQRRRGISWPISKWCRLPNGNNIEFHL